MIFRVAYPILTIYPLLNPIILLKYSMKQTRKHRQALKQKQKGYINHWNIGQNMKYYDALDDEYATYYFANPTVKKHFKRLEKVVRKEPKTVDLLRMTFLVQNKYSKNVSREGSIKSKEQESLNDSLAKSYSGAGKPQSMEKLKKVNKYQVQPEESEKGQQRINRAGSLQDKLPKVKNTKIFISRNQEKLLFPPKKSFVEYLQKKKQEIESREQPK